MFRISILYYIRSISKRKLFSFINITGLGLAIAFMILIGQYLYHEYSYNQNFKNSERIYRLVELDFSSYNLDYRIKEQIIGKIPGVKNVCLLNRFAVEVNTDDNVFKIENMLTVDNNFFKIFNISFISGNAETALNSINEVIITESLSKKIFGTTDAIGKTLRLNHEYDFLVTGIVNDLPERLSFQADLFVSAENSIKKRLYYRMISAGETRNKVLFNVFVETTKHSNILSIESQIASLNLTNNFLYPQKAKLTPLKSNYFNTEYQDYDLEHGNIGLIKLLSFIGFIILLLAIINFVNLGTAAYKYRMIEIGIKKCLGLSRSTLISQLLSESFYTCILAALVGIIFAEAMLPNFSQFIDKPIALKIFSDPTFFVLFILFVLFLSFLNGFFPALILSNISPVQIFRSNEFLKGAGKKYRSFLTSIQFSIAITLIFGLIVITKQIDFVKHKDLGFKTEKLIYLKVPYTLKNRANALYAKLKLYHGIKSITKTFGIPGSINVSGSGNMGSYDGEYKLMVIDSLTLKTFGFKLINGRDLYHGEQKTRLVNETAFKKLGINDFNDNKTEELKIAGVVADFNYSSLYNNTDPLILMYNNDYSADNITMRVSSPISEAIDYINNTWEQVCPEYLIEFGFYDEYFASMYKKEENLAALVSLFSILAIVISCMGIFGLSVFQSEQRVKEIGIRKVLGSSVTEIILLLIQDFIKWVLIANLLAFPIGYYLLSQWLEDFAYRIELSWWMFALSGVIALLIALTTVCFQAIKAAVSNPIDSLRNE